MAGLRSYECPRCGAPRQSLDDAVVSMCPYCGAVATVEIGPQTHARWVEATWDDIRDPNKRRAYRERRAELLTRTTKAAAAHDRDTWCAAMREVLLLDSEASGKRPKGGDESEFRRREVEQSLAIMELTTFDPEIVRLQAVAGEALAKIMPPQDWSSGKPRRKPGWTIERSIALGLEAAQAFVRLSEALAKRTGDTSIVASQYGRDTVTNSLTMMASLPGAALSRRETRAICAALDPGKFVSDSHHCLRCGAELGAADHDGLVRCASCGAVSRRG